MSVEDRALLRVCVTGAECTGKSSLAAALAEHYGARLVTECNRAYFEEKVARGDGLVTLEDIAHVAHLQAQCEDEAAQDAERLLICDTDVFTIAIWNERYLLQRSPEAELLAEQRATGPTAIALYLLCAPDIPWEPDSIRSHAELREDMHLLFHRRLVAAGRPFVVIEGEWERRMRSAIAAVDELLRRG